MYNFDVVIDRTGTSSVKWELGKEITPMWVADMDFPCANEIIDALKARLEHPVLGYTKREPRFYKPFIDWAKARYGFDVKEEWIVVTQGVVPAIGLSIMTYTNPNDGVLIMPPVYPPFLNVPNEQSRNRIDVPLVFNSDKNIYEIDFEALDAAASNAKMFIFCSPHNPVGRVWTDIELKKIGEIVLKHNLILISDEIHADVIMPGYKHISIANTSDALLNTTITCYAPNKTFNIAGLAIAFNVIPNEKLREQMTKTISKLGFGSSNMSSIEGSIAAYSHGLPWLEEALDYIHKNYVFLQSFLRENMPSIKMCKIEGTYLAWLDFRALNLTQDKLNTLLLEVAKVRLVTGTNFGNAGNGFQRLNLATSRTLLEEGLNKILMMVKSL